eukprot:TRINITY_DN2140_c0_g1_i1.p1 TRINITY_DN2140_c0_g1~~TRINITY_DN2140_c0_g1_i1.p1  ORF type:complete len:118 (+),score=56.18 TRINITY_DN2140_c0_g1_i1:25-378(+)
MSDQNLIVNLTVNPPYMTIVGPIRENTIQKLNSILPAVCSTVATDKTKFAFEHKDSPPHWFGELRTSFADEEIGQSSMVLALLDALEAEGGWKLKGSNATNHDFDKTTYKFFFLRSM